MSKVINDIIFTAHDAGGRKTRGRQLFNARWRDFEVVGGFGRRKYRVPSLSRPGEYHFVDRKRAFCTCEDFGFNNAKRLGTEDDPYEPCLHYFAVLFFLKLTACCAHCRERYHICDMGEVVASPLYEEGERLCAGCAEQTDSEVM